ncbi:energy transducer TonB [Pseudoalteromonas sp. GB56]
MQRPLLFGCVLLLATSGAHAAKVNYADVKLTHLDPIKEDAIWVRTKQVSPLYPLELAKIGASGCAILDVEVDDKGHTEHVHLVSSVPDKKRLMSKPTKKVVNMFKWQNQTGGQDRAETKRIRLDFCMGGESLEEAAALCELQAQKPCAAD